jgi:DNA-binding transcriptional LysR family regulator
MVTRRLATNRRVVVASPAYLEQHGAPQSPADLSRHSCLVVRENDDRPALWRLQALARPQRDIQTVRVAGPLSSNSGEVVRDWALAGRGLMLRSLWDVHEHLQGGRLVHVLPEYAMLDADVQFLMPARPAGTSVPKRVRALQEHLSRALAQPPWLNVPTRARARARPGPRPAR